MLVDTFQVPKIYNLEHIGTFKALLHYVHMLLGQLKLACDRESHGAVLNSKLADGSACVLLLVQSVIDRTEDQVGVQV